MRCLACWQLQGTDTQCTCNHSSSMHASQVVASHGRTMPVNDLMYDVKLEYNMEGTVPLSQLLYQMQLTEFAQPAADCIPRVHDIAHDDTRTAHNAFVSKPTAVRSYGLSNPDLEHLVVNNKIGHTDSPNSYYRLVDVLKAARKVRISRGIYET
ncbi:TPA: hypothetical protein ACH3X3_008446 [Trebouxia sp. C0006]